MYIYLLFNQAQKAKMLTTSIAHHDFCFSTLDDEKLSADIALGDDRLPGPESWLKSTGTLQHPRKDA